jgi:GcrA cell cycle regulator
MPSASTDTGWGDDAVSRLRSLWEEGHSTSEIACQLGVSKNAVIGKAHRLKLSRRPSPIRPAGSGGPRPSRRWPLLPKLAEIAPVPCATPKASPVDAASPPPPRGVSVPSVVAVQAAATQPFPRRGTISCCWPIGEPGTQSFHFCDAPARTGKPYCEEHCALACQKQRDRRDQTA